MLFLLTQNMTKNATRLASLMGTWTTSADVMGSFGNYQVVAYFVVHFMPDPMAQYSCQLMNCKEQDNDICQRKSKNYNNQNEIDNNNNNKRMEDLECHQMQDIVSDWSDVAAFYYIGFYFHAGIPFRLEKMMDTGGWIGPYNLVFAQDFDNTTTTTTTMSTNTKIVPTASQEEEVREQAQQDEEEDAASFESSSSSAAATTTTTTTLVDRYRIRYVETFSTPALTFHKPINNTLFIDWDTVMGTTAVNTTRYRQSTLHHGDNAYIDYQDSCDHGNLQPILPLYGFEFFRRRTNNNNQKQQQQQQRSQQSFETLEFSKNPKLQQQQQQNGGGDGDKDHDDNRNQDNNNEQEEISVEVDYQLLIAPKTHNKAYSWMPWIQKRIQKQKDRLGFTIDGPFCYGDDPKRAYVFPCVCVLCCVVCWYTYDNFYHDYDHSRF